MLADVVDDRGLEAREREVAVAAGQHRPRKIDGSRVSGARLALVGEDRDEAGGGHDEGGSATTVLPYGGLSM